MTMNEHALIPRRILFDNPDKSEVRISPDGSQLMWLAPLNGVINIWIAPRDKPHAAEAVTEDSGRGIRASNWTYNRDYILFIQDDGGDENWHLYSLELTTGVVRDLTPFDTVSAQIQARSWKHPDEIVVGLNHRNPQWHDLFRINIVSGERTLLLEQERFFRFVVDHELQLRFACEATADGGAQYYQRHNGDWRPWETVPGEDLYTTGIIGFDKTSRLIYMKDSRGRDTSALFSVNLETSERQLIAADSQADITGVMTHPSEKHVQAVTSVYTRKRWQIIDPHIELDFTYLKSLADGDFHITSRSFDDRFWVVVFIVDDGPARFYVYDREARLSTFLFTSRKELENLPLAKMNPVVVRSRDGLDLIAYYSLPPGSEASNGIPAQPLPMVFTPHGGPWFRDNWGCHPWHQWLTNRGYAVLAVNFRSSTGFGKAFVNAGNREWGGKIIEDQQDAVRWAIDAGIADPARIAIMGGSFGGYSVLAGLTFTPELFACGINMVGVANLITWMETIPPYWEPMRDLLIARVGDPRTETGRAMLKKHSPFHHVDNICKPLLVAQGANDPRVIQAESDQIVEALQSRQVPVTYLLYPDEGHGFVRPQNNQSFYAMVEAFLAQYIGGRCEPVGEAFEGSSAQILCGAELIKGLPEVLATSDKE